MLSQFSDMGFKFILMFLKEGSHFIKVYKLLR